MQSPWSYPLPDKTIPPRNPPTPTNFNNTSPYSSNISKSQNNTITLLQKAKGELVKNEIVTKEYNSQNKNRIVCFTENQLPRSGTTNYMQTERKQITQNHSPGIIRPNEVCE